MGIQLRINAERIGDAVNAVKKIDKRADITIKGTKVTIFSKKEGLIQTALEGGGFMKTLGAPEKKASVQEAAVATDPNTIIGYVRVTGKKVREFKRLVGKLSDRNAQIVVEKTQDPIVKKVTITLKNPGYASTIRDRFRTARFPLKNTP